MRRHPLTLVSVTLTCACSASAPQPPPLPPPPPPVGATALTATPEPQAPPSPAPPPPDCSIQSSCVADGQTRVAVGPLASVRPPAGWSFVTLPNGILRVVAPGEGAAMLFVRMEDTSAAHLWPNLYSSLADLKVTGVVPEAIDLAHPHGHWGEGDLRLRVWQVEKTQRVRGSASQARDPQLDGAPGALLIGLTSGDAPAILAIGFLKRSAPTDLVQPIRTTIESLSATSPPSAVSEPALTRPSTPAFPLLNTTSP